MTFHRIKSSYFHFGWINLILYFERTFGIWQKNFEESVFCEDDALAFLEFISDLQRNKTLFIVFGAVEYNDN